MNNQTILTDFLLQGFSDETDLQILHFGMFLCIYIIALAGNFLIITAVAFNHQLHTPMYFFLVNLSLSDVCFISTTVPQSMATSLTNNKLISVSGCFAQVFLVVTCAGSELTLLTVMAYDRYVAICHPLQYMIIMNWGACLQMAVASWVSNLAHAVIHTTVASRLDFCGSRIIDQYFCDIPQLLKISCADTQTNQILILVIGLAADLLCSGFIFVSYGYIFSTVLRIPSVQGRHKAISTCSPHLTVFSLFLVTVMFSYMRPQALSSPTVDLVSAVLYTVLPPLLNPIIYSFRNKDIQEAVWKMPTKFRNIYLSLIP